MPARKFDLARELRDALARESESMVRCLFHARRADVDGRADVASVLRALADGEMSQAFGHLELLEEIDPGQAGVADAAEDLSALVAAESAAVERYGALATAARAAGHGDAADWFDAVSAAEAAHLAILRRASEAAS